VLFHFLFGYIFGAEKTFVSSRTTLIYVSLENIHRNVKTAKFAVFGQRFAGMRQVDLLVAVRTLLQFFSTFAVVILQLTKLELEFAMLAWNLLMKFFVCFNIHFAKNFIAYLAFPVVTYAV
jgi:hypothetical protein